MKFFKKEHKYQSNIVDADFYKACPTNLTLLPFSSEITASRCPSDKTPFLEVTRVPYSVNPDIEALEKEVVGYKKSDSDNFAQDVFQTILDTIEHTWKPEKFHIVGHSSGYDSRLISKAIKLLAEKNGSAWLGDILFVENQGEGVGFKEIMKVQGWNENQYLCYNEGAKPGLHHASSLVFADYYKKFNGFGTYPVNQWYDSFIRLQEKGILPASEDVQQYTGYGANEVSTHAVRRANSIEWYARWHHHLQMDLFNTACDTVFPFWDYDYIRKVFYYSKLKNNTIPINEIISRVITPELNHIPRIDTVGVSNLGYRHIDESLMRQIWGDYINSWYGKRNPSVKQNNWLEYLDWWGHYCLASMCEHLINTGHKIR